MIHPVKVYNAAGKLVKTIDTETLTKLHDKALGSMRTKQINHLRQEKRLRCQICGKIFITKSFRAKACPGECRKVRRRQMKERN